jgi:hypothetical protein
MNKNPANQIKDAETQRELAHLRTRVNHLERMIKEFNWVWWDIWNMY